MHEQQRTEKANQRIAIERVREPRHGDELRVLVDRLWPRGVSKGQADLDLWAKNATPSTELRKDFHAGRMRFAEFSKAYRRELHEGEGLGELLGVVRGVSGLVVLLIAADPTKQNHAEVLRDVLLSELNAEVSA